MGDTMTDHRPRATLSDRVSIYTTLLLATPRARDAAERFLVTALHHEDLPRVLRASREVAS